MKHHFLYCPLHGFQVYHNFLHLDNKIIEHKQNFIDAFKKRCLEDIDLRSSIESSTKNIENYKIRYTKFQDLINNSFGLNLSINPFL